MKMLVTAGGTAIAWHISEIIKQFFNSKIDLYLCDTNESNLVPASINAVKTFKVPAANSDTYCECLTNIIKNNKIDVIVPLLPIENIIFAKDSDLVKKLNIISLAATLDATEKLTNKEKMYNFLSKIEIPSPQLFSFNDLSNDVEYIIKPKFGFGSRDIKIMKGKDIINNWGSFDSTINIIQEYCRGSDYDEVTVEIFNDSNRLKLFARRRLLVKAGVCVKTEIVDSSIFYPMIRKLVTSVELPYAFNVQFLLHNGIWKLYDCNLRLAAGTGLATAAGFQLTRAMLAKVVGEVIDDNFFNIHNNIKKILRVYKEIIIK
ncbi:MAG: ATP-grasp domain-containing protein [Phascolarctobacterium sp.]|nr:ATP-grasp domain-containing protein [Candidatus Phascolarctobacterium caballi]